MANLADAGSQPKVVANGGGAASDFSLVRGGPFYRLQQAAGLIDPGCWNLGPRLVKTCYFSNTPRWH